MAGTWDEEHILSQFDFDAGPDPEMERKLQIGNRTLNRTTLEHRHQIEELAEVCCHWDLATAVQAFASVRHSAEKLDIPCKTGRALFHAVESAHEDIVAPLSTSVRIAPFEVIELLFANRGSIKHGQLLHHAVLRKLDDRLLVVQYLLDMGAPLNRLMYQDKPVSFALREAFGLGHSFARRC
jgi:hypothetical protein